VTGPPAVIPQRFEERVPLNRLVPHPANPNSGDIGLLTELMTANGFAGAVMAQESTGLLIDGEHRWRAAHQQGMTSLPVLWVDCDDETRDRLLASWNESTRRGRNDESKLIALLQGFIGTPKELAGTAFDATDLDELVRNLNGPPVPPDAPHPDAATTADWSVVVVCAGEAEQSELLSKLTTEGYQAHPLTA
jgi:hypothetical protein